MRGSCADHLLGEVLRQGDTCEACVRRAVPNQAFPRVDVMDPDEELPDLDKTPKRVTKKSRGLLKIDIPEPSAKRSALERASTSGWKRVSFPAKVLEASTSKHTTPRKALHGTEGRRRRTEASAGKDEDTDEERVEIEDEMYQAWRREQAKAKDIRGSEKEREESDEEEEEEEAEAGSVGAKRRDIEELARDLEEELEDDERRAAERAAVPSTDKRTSWERERDAFLELAEGMGENLVAGISDNW